MEFFDLIQKRHSVRSYLPAPVEPEKLSQILEAARLAPTACNLQAFKIFVIETKNAKEEFKEIYRGEWLTEAPYVLCICSVTDQCWKRRDRKNYGEVDAAIVMDHIVLAATALGLGTCWIAAFDPAAVKSFLKLENSLEPIALTPLGYERETSFIKVRKEISELVEYR